MGLVDERVGVGGNAGVGPRRLEAGVVGLVDEAVDKGERVGEGAGDGGGAAEGEVGDKGEGLGHGEVEELRDDLLEGKHVLDGYEGLGG